MIRPLICVAILASGLAPGARASEVTTVTYEQTWQSARDDEEAPYIFGTPRPYRTDASGRIYVLDTQLQELHRFGRDGDYEGRIIAAGEGPGELSGCYDFTLWPGDRLAVPRRGGSVTIFDLDGRYVESIVFGAEDEASFGWMSAADAFGDAVVVRGERYDPQAQADVNVLGIYSLDGSPRHELHATARIERDYNRPAVTIREADTFFAGSRYVLGGDGLVYVAPARDSFLVVAYDLDGLVVRRIEIDWPSRRRSAEEIEATKKKYVVAADPSVKLPDITYEIEETAPVIRQLLWVDGALWVEIEREAERENVLGRFVVIGDDDEVVEVREIVVPGLTSQDHAQILVDGRVVVAKNYRSAVRSRYAEANMNVGGKTTGGDDDDAVAEGVYLIVYAPTE